MSIGQGLSQAQKGEQFAALHQSGCFIIPNPWDAGSACLLAGMGYLALATSSGAAAGVLGRKDGEISRNESIAHSRIVVAATDLPVAADLENGFGDAPADAALTIRRAAEVGLVGGSIEDASGINVATGERRIYDFNHAVERVAAAAEAAHAQTFPFTFTARCENFLRGKPDIDDTIRRLQAYEKSGADVLFAAGLPNIEAVRLVCQSLSKPFNFMAGIKGKSFSVAELEAAGVRRISLATSLYRAAMAGMRAAAVEAKQHGTFGYLDRL